MANTSVKSMLLTVGLRFYTCVCSNKSSSTVNNVDFTLVFVVTRVVLLNSRTTLVTTNTSVKSTLLTVELLLLQQAQV
jgi:hypothetical protein